MGALAGEARVRKRRRRKKEKVMVIHGSIHGKHQRLVLANTVRGFARRQSAAVSGSAVSILQDIEHSGGV